MWHWAFECLKVVLLTCINFFVRWGSLRALDLHAEDIESKEVELGWIIRGCLGVVTDLLKSLLTIFVSNSLLDIIRVWWKTTRTGEQKRSKRHTFLKPRKTWHNHIQLRFLTRFLEVFERSDRETGYLAVLLLVHLLNSTTSCLGYMWVVT